MRPKTHQRRERPPLSGRYLTAVTAVMNGLPGANLWAPFDSYEMPQGNRITAYGLVLNSLYNSTQNATNIFKITLRLQVIPLAH